MTATTNTGCSCGCNPCRCGTGATRCLPDLCPPRPTFFPGQLVTADDLNAVMTYFRAKNTLLSKLVAGWGVLGGMRLLQPGAKSFRMFAGAEESPPSPPQLRCVDTLLPNPQIVAGSLATITAGAAIDAAGNVLTQCSDTTIDVLSLAAGLSNQSQAKNCEGWFGEFCAHLPGTITAQQFWIVAEQVDVPMRPVPQYAGAGSCGSAPGCDFSRVTEETRIRLVADLPLLYFLHGCLDFQQIPCVDELIGLLQGVIDVPDLQAALTGIATSDVLAFLAANASATVKTANDAIVEAFGCVGFKFVPQLLEFVNAVIASTCCTSPAVVLGRVLLATDVPPEVSRVLGSSTYYLFIDDAFPYRRLVPNVAMHQTWVTTLLSILVCLNQGGQPTL